MTPTTSTQWYGMALPESKIQLGWCHHQRILETGYVALAATRSRGSQSGWRKQNARQTQKENSSFVTTEEQGTQRAKMPSLRPWSLGNLVNFVSQILEGTWKPLVTSRWKTQSWFSPRATHHELRGFYLFIHTMCIQVLCGLKTLLRLGSSLSTSQEAHRSPFQNNGSSLLLVLFPLTLSHDPRDSSIKCPPLLPVLWSPTLPWNLSWRGTIDICVPTRHCPLYALSLRPHRHLSSSQAAWSPAWSQAHQLVTCTKIVLPKLLPLPDSLYSVFPECLQ